jgi:tetratricopeptide (TPR) repeat protein
MTLEPGLGQKFHAGCYPQVVRRYIVAFVVLAGGVAAGATSYIAYATDREYTRLIASGDEAIAEGRPYQAIESYSGAIALRPESMVAHLKRGDTYRDRGQLEAALRDLRRASELDPTATLPLELLGDTNLALLRFDRAIERYETCLNLDDRSARVWYKLGLARYRASLPAPARDALQKAISLDKGRGEAYLLLGLSFRDLGEATLARRSLETAAQLAPALTEPREALAGLFTSLGENGRAIDQLEALAALDPNRPDRHVALGLAHASARRYEAAVLTLSRAVERFPDETAVYAALGRVWLEAAETRDDPIALKKAVQALSTAASHQDAASDTLTDLGRALVASGDDVAAERALRQAVTRLPIQPDAYRYLATIVIRDGRVQDARDSLIRYVTLVGDAEPVAGIATQIASYSLRLGDPQLALRWIDRAIDEGGPTSVLAALKQRAEAASRTQ